MLTSSLHLANAPVIKGAQPAAMCANQPLIGAHRPNPPDLHCRGGWEPHYKEVVTKLRTLIMMLFKQNFRQLPEGCLGGSISLETSRSLKGEPKTQLPGTLLPEAQGTQSLSALGNWGAWQGDFQSCFYL